MINLDKGIEFNVLDEKVILRGLTVEEIYGLQQFKSNTEYSFCYAVGKLGIVSFEFINETDKLEIYKQNDENFEALFSQNYSFVRECAFIILNKLSIISDTERDWLKSFIAFNFYLSDKEQGVRDAWSCKQCIEKKSMNKRKCSRFDQQTIERIIKENYRPTEVFGLEESVAQQRNYQEESEKELSDKAKEQIDKRNSKLSAKKQIEKRKQKNQESQETLAESSESDATHVLKTPYYKWKECPVHRGDKNFFFDLNLLVLSVTQEKYLFPGELLTQPARFIEFLNEYQSESARIKNAEEKRMMKESESKSKQARGRS